MHFKSEVCGAHHNAELRRKYLSAVIELFLVPDFQLICDAQTVLPPPPLTAFMDGPSPHPSSPLHHFTTTPSALQHPLLTSSMEVRHMAFTSLSGALCDPHSPW